MKAKKVTKGKADKPAKVKKVEEPSFTGEGKSTDNGVTDEKAQEKARMKEVMQAARKLLKGDKENLAKLGKHELMAFYDTRFKSENDSNGALMIVFGDTLNMGKEDTIMVVSCGNVLLKKCVYGYAVGGNGNASIGRVDKKPVTMEDGKVLVKAYEKFMGNVKKKGHREDKVKRN